MSPLSSLLKANFRAWVSAKGFWLVAAGALLPLVLTGAWVASHTADLEMTEVKLPEGPFEAGEQITFTAVLKNVGSESVGPFNATISVHDASRGDFQVLDGEPIAVSGLNASETKEINWTWSATAGVFAVIAQADSNTIIQGTPDEIGERDEYNNYKVIPLTVVTAAPTQQPSAPIGLAGDENATTEIDLVVESVTRSSADPAPGENVTFTLTVRNNGLEVADAPVTLRVGRAVGIRTTTLATEQQNLTFATGETKTITLTWPALAGAFWAEGFVTPPADSKDVAADNNYKAEGFAVSNRATADVSLFEPEPEGTIKVFYLQVLSLLHLRLLIPLIALFYAAGVIADEKERGSLPYLLTRPIPRWLIPITKFVASFLVASLATIVGVILTYAFLFGTTVEGGNIGFLTTPLLASLLTLFVYGALFILLGTLVERPYLWGIAIVLGWENAANMLVPWVRNLTLNQHISNALGGDAALATDGWRLDAGLQWLPEGAVATRALLVLLAIGIGALAVASAQMRRREFAVG